MMDQKYTHFQLTIDEDSIIWLAIDRAGASVNSLSRELFDELNTILETIDYDAIKGIIITSAKKKGFVAGADISQFTKLETTDEAYDLIRQAQVILDKLEAVKVPTVAMIDGFCLGGGLELALACRYRVATDEAHTLIGLPEIKLGIHPGWGGTVRLPKLIGPEEAMKMILPGAAYPARKCAKIGIIDAAVPVRMLKRAARYYVTKHPEPRQSSAFDKFKSLPLLRPLVGYVLKRNLTKRKINPAHYPAPYAVVENWVKDGAEGNAMLNEARSIAKLMLTDTARNLVRIFFLQEKMKGIAKKTQFNPSRVHVIGAGTMGGDIAAWCALKGMQVTLQDQSAEKIAPAMKRAYKLFEKKCRKPNLIQAAMDRLQPDETGAGVSRADVIIEAVFENLSVKQQIFKHVEENAKPDAIMATNTSSIPLEEIAVSLKDPSRLVGIHFFNPVAKMPLVEIVCGKDTDQSVQAAAAAFVGKISRLPLPVASHPGFLVNRVLMPYLMEAMTLFEEGADPLAIDSAAVRFGMPMGPITLADKVGLDVCLNVAENLMQHFGGEVPSRLKSMVKAGRLGVKTGCGFYKYNQGKKVKTDQLQDAKNPANMADRMLFRMLNEAVACLSEGVISDADLLDGGMIFGTGFAPFRGGPIQYAKARGVQEVVSTLEGFESTLGERFKPHSGWQQLISSGDSKAESSVDHLKKNSDVDDSLASKENDMRTKAATSA